MDLDLEALKKHEEWNESYYFNFYDESNDLTAFMRIGNKVNKNEKSMFFYLMSPTLLAGVKLETPCDSNPLSLAGLDYLELEDGKWRLTYQGPIFNPQEKSQFTVNMDVTWEALNPLMDYVDCVDEKEAEMSSNVASEHYEQFGQAQGTIDVDGDTLQIEGVGERDLSRGVREWGSPRMWMWINSAFSHQEAFNITKLSVEEGDVDAGYFYTGGVNHPLVKSEVELVFEDEVPSRFTMALEDKDGQKYSVTGEVVRYGLIPMDDTMYLFETLSRYSWNGKEGYGVAEFLIPKLQRTPL
ncbi:MAG: hypothetical protein ABFC91_00195 [Methanobacteriaceae archaeon]